MQVTLAQTALLAEKERNLIGLLEKKESLDKINARIETPVTYRGLLDKIKKLNKEIDRIRFLMEGQVKP